MNKVSEESDNDHSKDEVEKKQPLDEKMDQDDYKTDHWNDDIIEINTESKSLETQWTEFHRCKNKITFALQLVAVLSVQGRLKTKSWFTSVCKPMILKRSQHEILRILLCKSLWTNC